MNQFNQILNQRFKSLKNSPKAATGTEMLTGWLSVEYHLTHGLRISPDYTVRISFPRGPSVGGVYTGKKLLEHGNYEQNTKH